MKTFIIYMWTLFDPVYYSLTRLITLQETNEWHPNIFRVRLAVYRGAAVTLSDGTQIQKNDVLLKIHLHNIRLIRDMNKLQHDFQKARFIYRTVQQSLPGVASYIQSLENSENIKGIMGITTLNKGCKRLGFDSMDIHSHIYRWFKWIPNLMITLLASSDTALPAMKRKKPAYILMSKETLFRSFQPIHSSDTNAIQRKSASSPSSFSK
ncbi:hypothetical protein SAMN05192534_14414 [Alteribacillus persepolensis]|uniref:YkoP-like domain-containing protein n=1 Tax=Alteribacillus persepolensis TaxID=568899 RepID=A0A1G8KAV8_9BACI|nr:hypothetical protein [Alteribacillus persepolensis]SDI40568.1 hypothetical protein SAMN05192534_14414 [Alteribacillus persepolensis]